MDLGHVPCPGPARHACAARGPRLRGRAGALWAAPVGTRLRRHRAVGVCRFLCLKNKSSASVVFTTYTQKHPSIENGPPFVQPLLNFIWFLLLALDG